MTSSVVIPQPRCSLTPDFSRAAEPWQQIFALDMRYCFIRPTTKDNAQLRQLYLRRRSQLTREYCRIFTPEPEGFISEEEQRSRYRHLREQLLSRLYGPAPKCSTSRSFTLSKTRSYDGSLRQPSCINFSVSEDNMDYFQTPLVVTRLNPTPQDQTFSVIEHIFDHHKGAINRIRFANQDSSRLAIASADGTISVCRTSPPGDEIGVLFVLKPAHPILAPITDLVWSATNEFLLSTSLNGHINLWDVNKVGLARSYSDDAELGPLLVCIFQPANNNFFIVGGVRGMIQTINLSTGKPIKKGRDQLHMANPLQLKKQFSPTLGLSDYLGKGCVTALEFENDNGSHLWVGTDRGILQSYTCQPSTGSLTRSQRFDIARLCPTEQLFFPDMKTPESATAKVTNSKSLKAKLSMLRSASQAAMQHTMEISTRSNLIVTSLAMHSWLSRDTSDSYLLVTLAGLGLLLFCLSSPGRTLTLKQCFPSSQHQSLGFRSYTHLLHSCFAPLMSFHSGACAVSGSEEGNVYIYNVFAVKSHDQNSPQKSTTSRGLQSAPGLISALQGHTAPVIDVAISWDETVMASADGKGSVILWRQKCSPETTGGFDPTH